jgi:hypothetical protein
MRRNFENPQTNELRLVIIEQPAPDSQIVLLLIISGNAAGGFGSESGSQLPGHERTLAVFPRLSRNQTVECGNCAESEPVTPCPMRSRGRLRRNSASIHPITNALSLLPSRSRK